MKNVPSIIILLFLITFAPKNNFTQELNKNSLGNIIYVSTSGTENGSGTFESPFREINQAMEIAQFGDKILVLPGIYEERIAIKMGITLSSSGIEPAIIKSIDHNEMILMNSNTKLEGFIILQSHSGLVIFAQGIGISIINNNIISEVNGPPGTAIMFRNSEAEISQNYISAFYAAIQGSGKINTELPSNIVINNNLIKCLSGIEIGDDCETEIYNNTIIFGNENGDHGRGIKARFADNLNVTNNILISATDNSGIVISNDGSYTTTINTSYNNFWNYYAKYDGDVNEIQGCINVDPLFKDVTNNDYRLKEDSPCINTGDPLEKYNDLDSTRNDMGAYGGQTPFNCFSKLEIIKKLSIQNCSGFPGDTISTFISLDSPDSLLSATLKLEFDSSILTYLRSTLTNNTSSFSIDDELNSSNQININMEGKVTPEYESNNILELSFIVKSNLYSGDASPLTIVNTDLLSESLSTIFLTSITDGVFVVNLGSKEGKYVYVDINSSETQNGNRTNPFQSLQDAIDFSSPEDTIIVAPGEYFGPFTMKDSVFLKGSGASVTELNIDFDLYFDVPVLSFYSVNHSSVSGFTIHSQEFMEAAAIYCNNSSPTITENYLVASFINAEASAIICENKSHPIISRNTTENCKISVFNSNPVIKNNSLKGTAGGMSSVEINENSMPTVAQNKIYAAEAGISIFNSNPVIENNKIILENFGGHGFYISQSDSCIIRNNIILDSSEDGIGLFIQNSPNINILNNSISTNRNGIWSLSSSGSIVNNIIMGNSSAGILAPGFTNIDYNCLWNNTLNYENTISGNNDIYLNPLLESGSFNLSETSPCINTGIPNLVFNDIDGSRNDIGAFGGPFADLAWVEYESCNLEINNKNEYLNDTIYVAINGSNVTNIANIDLSLSYDSNVLEFLNAESTDLTKSFSVSKSLAYNNNVDLDLISRNGIKSDSGSVILLSFLNKSESSTKTYLNFNKANLVDDVLSNRSISQLKDGEINIIVTDINDNKIPQSFHLSQNYPNPFNPSTILEYSLPQKSFVELNIYDILGRQVEKLVNAEKLAGNYKIEFNAGNLASGIYFYRIKAENYSKTMKMVLIR